VLKSVYAIPHAPSRLRVPESVEQGQDGGCEYRKKDRDVRFPPCPLIAALTGRLQWENVANAIDVVFGNPYVFIHSGHVTRVQKLSEGARVSPTMVRITAQSGKRKALKQLGILLSCGVLTTCFSLHHVKSTAPTLRPYCRGRGGFRHSTAHPTALILPLPHLNCPSELGQESCSPLGV
jgi:hypothetical protein